MGELQEAAVQALLAQLETEYEVNNAVTTDIDPNLLTNFELLDD